MTGNEIENLALMAKHMNVVSPIDWEMLQEEYGISEGTIYESIAGEVIDMANNLPDDAAFMMMLAITTQLMVKNTVLEMLIEDKDYPDEE